MHGYVSLEPETQILYKFDQHYFPKKEFTIRFDDPYFGIKWPDFGFPYIISDRDLSAPYVSDVGTPFKERDKIDE